MLKKVTLVSLMMAVLVVAVPKKAEAAYSDGAAIGASLFFGYPNQGLTLVGQFDGVPLMFGVQAVANIFNDGYQYFGVGLTMDWWGLKIPLGKAGESDVHFYLGPGLAADTAFGSNYWSINAGLRMPIGFSFLIKNQWEIFLEPAPVVNVLHADSYGVSLLGFYLGDTDDRHRNRWNIGHFLHLTFQFGFRYWF
ncbi:hypothetical protein [Brachyspira hampsonii]|uniref:hypothetical protein n=1 Tax=Brachyspira hampsonii TaxID=1287055 RepID=UPI000D383D35|nr:hypothetical protein [Brachyspira hampsonii]PTY39912.1 hypothetical protein DQ06_04705 [Brachyspira hampsonii bv. II]